MSARVKMDAERVSVTRVLRVPYQDDAVELDRLRVLMRAASAVRKLWGSPEQARAVDPEVRARLSAEFAAAVDACLAPLPTPAPLKLYVTVGKYQDGSPGELFLKAARQGSFPSGILEALGIAVSIGLQHGVPLKDYLDKFVGMRFEPGGFTGDRKVPVAKSLIDYMARWLRDHFTPGVPAESDPAGDPDGGPPPPGDSPAPRAA